MALPFCIDDDGYFWPVSIPTAVDGEVVDCVVEIYFNRVGQKRKKEILALCAEANKAYQEGGTISEIEEISDELLAAELVGGWRGVVNKNGEEQPFTEEGKSILLNRENAAAAIVSTWFDSLSQRKAGNSQSTQEDSIAT